MIIEETRDIAFVWGRGGVKGVGTWKSKLARLTRPRAFWWVGGWVGVYGVRVSKIIEMSYFLHLLYILYL